VLDGLNLSSVNEVDDGHIFRYQGMGSRGKEIEGEYL
jgi:hypothetical protein